MSAKYSVSEMNVFGTCTHLLCLNHSIRCETTVHPEPNLSEPTQISMDGVSCALDNISVERFGEVLNTSAFI